MKYALVTGGSRGLGRAVCLKLAEMGIPVVINYQSSEQAAQEVKTECEAQGVQAELLKFNVGDMEAVNAAIERGEQVIFNLAGQRVNKATKGMYIINGKKVVIK